MNPLVERALLQLQPLPPAAEELLRQYHAAPRLIAHLILVHDVAAQLISVLQDRCLADMVVAPAVLFGAAIHDIGTVLHPQEMIEPGHQHEYAGKQLLLQADVPPELARFAETHGKPLAASNTIDDHLVALADTSWKGKRDRALEQHVAAELAAHQGQDMWIVFLAIDDLVECIATTAEQRLIWQAGFPTDAELPA